jgi:hypothetical protein
VEIDTVANEETNAHRAWYGLSGDPTTAMSATGSKNKHIADTSAR